MPSGVEEHESGVPDELVVTNARAKRDDVARRISTDALVLAADTVVTCGDHVLGKPDSHEDARRMLTMLSGRTHSVFTGLAVCDTASGKTAEGAERTSVTFRTLRPGDIDRFIESVNPVDRAGAYTVDGPGSLLVERYEGCYYNVLGLPLVRLDCLLDELGFRLFDMMDGSRAAFL